MHPNIKLPPSRSRHCPSGCAKGHGTAGGDSFRDEGGHVESALLTMFVVAVIAAMAWLGAACWDAPNVGEQIEQEAGGK